jgi:hypothetical protein
VSRDLDLDGVDADVVGIEERAPSGQHVVKIAWVRDGVRTGETFCMPMRPVEACIFRVGQRIRVGLHVWA